MNHRRVVAILLPVSCAFALARCGGSESVADDAGGVDASRESLVIDADGTATDSASGLTWQVTPANGIIVAYSDAVSYCQSLTLAGGGWHLPTVSELRTLIRGCAATQTNGACGVRDTCPSAAGCLSDACKGCNAGNGPDHGFYGPVGLGGDSGWYWTATDVAGVGGKWVVDFDTGRIYTSVGYGDLARCAR